MVMLLEEWSGAAYQRQRRDGVSLVVARIEHVELIYEGWGKFLRIRVRRDDGSTITHQVDDHGNGVFVLPYDPIRKIAIVVRQVRPAVLFAGNDASILEAPAGRLDTAEPEQCARREVLEETGIHVADLEYVGTFWVSPATSTERAHLYLGRYSESDRVAEGGGVAEEDEQITVEEVPIQNLVKMAESGQMDDVKMFAAIQTLRLRYPEICQ
jgi:nudix-type nucleoside diphosphatase (YffH/AdpP family)